jgi:hypothetical protein
MCGQSRLKHVKRLLSQGIAAVPEKTQLFNEKLVTVAVKNIAFEM